MDWFATTPDRPAFFALAQKSTGIIAIGQGAVGVVAIGQVAVGCIAIGQGAFGWIGWGQGGVGIFHGVGMLGMGGRSRGMLSIPLVPRVGKPRELPIAISFADVWAGQAGWVEVTVDGAAGVPVLLAGGQRLPVKIAAKLVGSLSSLAAVERRRTLAYFSPRPGCIVCERVVYEPPRPFEARGSAFATHLAVGFVALVGVAVAWWAFVGKELVRVFEVVFG